MSYKNVDTKSLVDGTYWDDNTYDDADEGDIEIDEETYEKYMKSDKNVETINTVDLFELSNIKDDYKKTTRIKKPKKKVLTNDIELSPLTPKYAAFSEDTNEQGSERIVNLNKIDFRLGVSQYFHSHFERVLDSTTFQTIRNEQYYETKRIVKEKLKRDKKFQTYLPKMVVDDNKQQIAKVSLEKLKNTLNVSGAKLTQYASAVIGSVIWIHGGTDGNKTYSTLRSFNTKTNEWVMYTHQNWREAQDQGFLKHACSGHKMISIPSHNQLFIAAVNPSTFYSVTMPSKPHLISELTIKKLVPIPYQSIGTDRSQKQCLPVGLSDFSLTELGSYCYYFGGRSHEGPSANLWTLTVNKGSVNCSRTSFENGPCARYGHSAAHNNHLIIFGGNDGKRFLNDLWTFDGQNWKEIVYDGPRMIPSAFHSLICVGYNLILYGGQTKSQALDSGYKFDFSTNLWTAIKPMGPSTQSISQYQLQTPLFGAGSCLVDNDMYLIGGTTTDRVLHHTLVLRNVTDQSMPFLLTNHLKKMRMEEYECDLDFILMDGQNQKTIVKAHKAIIASRSPNLLNHLEIQHVKTEIFVAYLDFLYCGEFKVEGKENLEALVNFSAWLEDHHTELLQAICFQGASFDVFYEIIEDLENDLGELVDDPDTADITLVLDDGEDQIFAHRIILSRSPYFLRMLKSGMKESQTNTIEFPDVDKEAILVILKFLYTDNIEVTSENCVGVLVYSLMFGLSELCDYCRSFIGGVLSPSNVIQILEMAETYNDVSLKRLAMTFIKKNYHDVNESGGLDEIDSKTRDLLLEYTKKEIAKIKQKNNQLKQSKSRK